MPNFAVSQTTATLHYDRLLQPDRKASLIDDLVNLFSTNTAYVRQDGGYTTAGVRMLTAWTLSGVVLSDATTNCAAGGRLWIRVTANGGNWDIHVYKATGAASEVMTATNVAAGATATLSAANSSGMTGTCVLASSIAAVAADTYSLQVFLGYPEYDRQVFNGQQEDADILKEQVALNNRIASQLAAIRDSLSDSSESASMRKQTGRIWTINKDLPFVTKSTSNDSDVISVNVDGVFERLRQNWADNTTVQKVAVTTLSAGSASYASSNSGASSCTVGTVGPNLEAGTIQAVCDEDTLPNVRFSITFTPTDGVGAVTARNKLTVGKAWDDPDIPISLSLTPTYLKSLDDGDNTDIAAVSAITGISGLTADNSDDGKLYGKTVLSGSAFIFKFYADSSLTRLVAQSTAVANDTAFSATEQNRSGITVGWKSGSACADGDLWAVDIQPHKKGTSTTAPDQFTIAITASATGRIQDTARRFHGWKLNQGGSPTFADSFLNKGSLFLDGAI